MQNVQNADLDPNLMRHIEINKEWNDRQPFVGISYLKEESSLFILTTGAYMKHQMSKNSIIDNQVELEKQRENILPLPIDYTNPKLIKFYPLQYGVEILMNATTITK